MRMVLLIGFLSVGILAACSGSHNQSTDPGAMSLATSLAGGTSSGGPAARLKIYAHCSANDGFLTLDLVGDLSSRQAQLSTGLSPCNLAWRPFSETPGAVGLIVSSGNQELAIGAPISNEITSGPHVNFSGTWTDGASITPMVCSVYDGYQSTSGCASGETEILKCSAFGTSICIQEN